MDQQSPHQANASLATTEIERRILENNRHFENMTVPELKQNWHDFLGTDVPPFAKRGLLTQVLAEELQAKSFGGLTAALRRQLNSLGASVDKGTRHPKSQQTPALRPGVKLLRVWKGVTHHVMVTEDGYEWQNRTCKSLSAIAREITGTPWSGPVFFGLKTSKTKPMAVAAEYVDG